MPGLKIKITTAGRQALVNAERTGTRGVTIAAVGLTSAAFVAQAGLTALPSENQAPDNHRRLGHGEGHDPRLGA